MQYPLDFDELWDQSIEIELPQASLRIASIEHLILMKHGAGRPQDLADIEALDKLKQYLELDEDTDR